MLREAANPRLVPGSTGGGSSPAKPPLRAGSRGCLAGPPPRPVGPRVTFRRATATPADPEGASGRAPRNCAGRGTLSYATSDASSRMPPNPSQRHAAKSTTPSHSSLVMPSPHSQTA